MLKNRIYELSNAPGSSTTVILTGTPSGIGAFRTFAAVFATGDTCYFELEDDAQWQLCVGTFALGPPATLAITEVVDNSQGNANRLNFTGETRVFCTLPSQRTIFRDSNGVIKVRNKTDTNWIMLGTIDEDLQLFLASERPGSIIMWPASTPPTGWLVRDGSLLSRASYPALYGVLGTQFGAGDGTQFGLPDDRGIGFRGWDNGRGMDPGRTFGSYQADAFGVHGHGVNESPHGHQVNDGSHQHYTNLGNIAAVNGGPGGALSGSSQNGMNQFWTSWSTTGIWLSSSITGLSIQSSGGSETRMKNRAYLPVIKY